MAGPDEREEPTAEEVSRYHTRADTDSRPEALHHTLGPGANQAAAGDHNHRDGTSNPILAGINISGSRATDTWRLSIEQALVALGASTSSTA